MVRLSHLLPLSLTILGAYASSAVLDLIPDNFDRLVLESGKPALVEFFAPWCGHCKALAPVYEELGQAFASAGDKVIIGKVDADKHKALGKRFGVQGFPTLMWFDGKSDTPDTYNKARDLDSLTAFVTEKSGVTPKTKVQLPSKVVMLNDTTFKKEVGGDRNVFVAFTAPWCGHCKNLAPIWETLAEDYIAEPEVIIAKVDAEAPNCKAITAEYGVKSYPTIKYFAKGSTDPQPYNGGRSEEAFITYVNEQAGTHRAVGGGLDAQGGTVAALDAIVERVRKSGESIGSAINEFTKAANDLGDKYAGYYLKVVEKVGNDDAYLEKELNRLEGILNKGGLAPEKVDDLTARTNILRKFNSPVKDESRPKEEL